MIIHFQKQIMLVKPGMGCIVSSLLLSLKKKSATAITNCRCVIKAVNLGRDTDTTAAVAGALAGMWYGAESIPIDWTEALAKHDEIRALSRRFAYACLNARSE